MSLTWLLTSVLFGSVPESEFCQLRNIDHLQTTCEEMEYPCEVAVYCNHSNKILTIQEGYPQGVSSVGTPRPTQTGITDTLGEHLQSNMQRPVLKIEKMSVTC